MFSETGFMIVKYTFKSLMHFMCIKVNVYHHICAYPPHLHEIIYLYLCEIGVALVSQQVQVRWSFPKSKLKLNLANVVV